MNVLYVSNSFSFLPTHAAVVTTFEIVKRLAKKGQRVTMLVPNFEDNKLGGSEVRDPTVVSNLNILSFTSASASAIQKNFLSYGLLSSLWYLPLIIKVLKRRPHFDVVISMYHPSHLATFSAYFISSFLKLPLIVKVHDLLPDAADPNALRRIYKKAMFKLNRALLKKADMILVPSSEWMSLATEVYGVSQNKLVLFPNGVDSKKFHPHIECTQLRRRLKLGNKKVIVFAGQVSEIRGLDYLIQAMGVIVREETNVRLLIIGDGSEKSKLLAQLKLLHLEDFVVFVGCVNHEIMPSYIALGDVAIGPLTMLPITVGTLPIKVLEYMACGKPVVACYGGQSKDLITNGSNGVLVNPRNIDELASAIMKLLKDDEFAKDLGAAARKHVDSLFDWDTVIEGLQKILSIVCQ